MIITKQQIRQLIKEELSKVLKENEELNEGAMSVMLAARLLSGVGGVDAPDGTNMQDDSIVSVLQTIHDSGDRGKEAVEFIGNYAQNGLFSDTDGDGRINIKTPYPDYNDVINDYAQSVLDTDATPGTSDVMSKLQGETNPRRVKDMVNKISMEQAKELISMDGFKNLDPVIQKAINSKAGLMNPVR